MTILPAASLNPTRIGLILCICLLCFGKIFGISNFPSSFDPVKVKQDILPFDFSKEIDYSQNTIDYFTYYGLHYKNTEHIFGSFTSGRYSITGHVFLPEDPRGTVFLLHGYYDHAGILTNLISHCLNKNYAVAVFDLPGHGLSDGEPASIDDFAAYVSVFEDFIGLCERNVPKPYHVISHSTGCSVVFEYLYVKDQNKFTKVVFLAPVVQPVHWRLATIGYFIMRPFTKSVFRVFRKSSSVEGFNEFVKNDPLQCRKVPLSFVKALKKWKKRIKKYDPLHKQVVIIQGTNDTTVNWKYSISFLKKKIIEHDVRFIKNARHQLVNESEEIQRKVFSNIDDVLGD